MFQKGTTTYFVPNADVVFSYTYTGRKSDYKEVTALLKQSGIDLDHNRFLILQVCNTPPPHPELFDIVVND